MSMDFPATPTTGQTFDPGTGIVYAFDGVAWNAVTTSTATAQSRNRIINPTMVISQEQGNNAGTTTLFYAADQWFVQFTTTGAVSFVRVASITPKGSQYRIRLSVTTADTSIAAGEYCEICQKIEGFQVDDFLYGTAAARQAILRFGFKGPAGTYGVSILNGAADRSYIAMFTIAAGQANTDTEQVLVIPGDVTGTWDVGSTTGMWVRIILAVGTTFQGVLGWQAGGPQATSAISNGLGVVNNVFELFDVGLYLDAGNTGVPPPFEAPEYATTQIKCQRYWRTQAMSLAGYGSASGEIQSSLPISPFMRISPTLSILTAGTVSNAAAVNSSATFDRINTQLQPTAVGVMGVYNRTYALNARM